MWLNCGNELWRFLCTSLSLSLLFNSSWCGCGFDNIYYIFQVIQILKWNISDACITLVKPCSNKTSVLKCREVSTDWYIYWCIFFLMFIYRYFFKNTIALLFTLPINVYTVLWCVPPGSQPTRGLCRVVGSQNLSSRPHYTIL